jgi:hypothetical protein
LLQDPEYPYKHAGHELRQCCKALRNWVSVLSNLQGACVPAHVRSAQLLPATTPCRLCRQILNYRSFVSSSPLTTQLRQSDGSKALSNGACSQRNSL